jgi:hypothetical protein
LIELKSFRKLKEPLIFGSSDKAVAEKQAAIAGDKVSLKFLKK